MNIILAILLIAVLLYFTRNLGTEKTTPGQEPKRGKWTDPNESDLGELSNDERFMQEWRSDLREHLGLKRAKELEPCLRKLFGGEVQCAFNFRMFAARVGFGKDAGGPAVFIVPRHDHYRPRFETLASTGAVLKGVADIPLRLEKAPIDQVRAIANELGLGKSRSKAELIKRIAAAEKDAAEAALATAGLGQDDCFLLDPARVLALCR